MQNNNGFSYRSNNTGSNNRRVRRLHTHSWHLPLEIHAAVVISIQKKVLRPEGFRSLESGERGHKNRLGGMTNEEHKMSAFSPFPNLTIGKNLLRKTAVGSVCVPFHCGIARIIGGRLRRQKSFPLHRHTNPNIHCCSVWRWPVEANRKREILCNTRGLIP